MGPTKHCPFLYYLEVDCIQGPKQVVNMCVLFDQQEFESLLLGRWSCL